MKDLSAAEGTSHEKVGNVSYIDMLIVLVPSRWAKEGGKIVGGLVSVATSNDNDSQVRQHDFFEFLHVLKVDGAWIPYAWSIPVRLVDVKHLPPLWAEDTLGSILVIMKDLVGFVWVSMYMVARCLESLGAAGAHKFLLETHGIVGEGRMMHRMR